MAERKNAPIPQTVRNALGMTQPLPTVAEMATGWAANRPDVQRYREAMELADAWPGISASDLVSWKGQAMEMAAQNWRSLRRAVGSPSRLFQQMIASGVVDQKQIAELNRSLTQISPQVLEGLGIAENTKEFSERRLEILKVAEEARARRAQSGSTSRQLAEAYKEGLQRQVQPLAHRTRPSRAPAVPPATHPAPRRGRPRRPVAPAPAPAKRVLPSQVAEVFAQQLIRTDYESAEKLLLETGLNEALEHFRAIEVRLREGTRPGRTHAALSAGLLLKGLADHLYPARKGTFNSRFGSKYKQGATHVMERLLSFADPIFRETLSASDHRLFIARMGVVCTWTGKGHHVSLPPKDGAEAYCQLIQVLATIARAYRVASA